MIWFHLSLRLKGIIDETLQSRRFHIRRVFLDSTIMKELPPILSRFDNKQMTLLYRGSRDGVQGSSFHSRCDGKPHTITIIETTKGYIFGGYTPIPWESSSGTYKTDDSLSSFIFTLKNPQNTNPRLFQLKPANKVHAIRCQSNYGPIFGGGHDFDVDLSGSPSSTILGHSYNNDTGANGQTVLAGESTFMVKEIEVFGMT
jgi:hypothetical protein